MSELNWRIVESDLGKTVFVFLDGQMRDANETNPAFAQILEKCRNDDSTGLIDLFDAEKAVTAKFKTLTDNISLKGDDLYYQGDVMEDVFADAVVRLIREGKEELWAPTVKFLEKVHSNRDKQVREHFSRWIKASGDGFSIDNDGDVRGYKGLQKNFTSVHSGPGIVNGEEKNGYLDNTPGNVVEIARSKVVVDPKIGCASGLHVGTWNYASTFHRGGKIVEVKFDPRHVVSVPFECQDQKVRVSKYEVIKEVTKASDTFLV